MSFERASGLLLHPTSLPGRFGIGDLGDEAFKFCDILASAGQKYWQILPLGPTGYGDSPYQCFSAFAGNTLLISPEKLRDDGLIEQKDIDECPEFDAGRVDYGGVYGWKTRILRKAFESFSGTSNEDLDNEFRAFTDEHSYWLDTYALYRAIKNSQDHRPWYEWPDELRSGPGQVGDDLRDELLESRRAEQFYQFLFHRQWQAVKHYANDRGIQIIGDVPIFIALDSADVWAHQDQFKLNPDGSARVVAGVPPDFFSSTGQLWGNPIYEWDVMRKDAFGWWVRRFRSTLESVDIVRLDHFRGFAAAWEVPGGDPTAEHGSWVDVPGRELFSALKNEMGDLPVIAEDLGAITPDVVELREEFGFPGMRILQFAFGGDAGNHDLPHNYTRDCVAYTGTHDNDTCVGWFDSLGEGDPAKEHCLRYLDSDGGRIHWDMVRAIWASVADIAIAPVQDILGMGGEGRMNLPASTGGNWQWRLSGDAITDDIAGELQEMTKTYGRSRR